MTKGYEYDQFHVTTANAKQELREERSFGASETYVTEDCRFLRESKRSLDICPGRQEADNTARNSEGRISKPLR